MFVQVDCFQRCTSHVSSSLPETTWKVWARAIASTTCNNISAEPEDTINQRWAATAAGEGGGHQQQLGEGQQQLGEGQQQLGVSSNSW